MDNNENKISKKSLMFMIFTIVAVLMAGTFAWLSYRTQDTAMVLTVGDIKGLTVTLKPYQIKGTLSPVSGYSSGKVVDVTAQNNSTSLADNFTLYYAVETIDNALKNAGFKYTITKSTNNGSSYTQIKEGNFLNAANGKNLEIYQENVPANTTYKYKVYIWIDSSAGNQSSMQNKSFVAELRASVSQTLYSMMKDQAVMDNISSTYVSNSNGIQFNAISSDTNGKGVYIRSGTENDPHSIYYYRGAVTNNNVLFANFCWKIVRTTDTGGVKLIYNGTPSSGKCTNTTGEATQLAATSAFNGSYNSPAYVGYMYGTVYPYTEKEMTSISAVYQYGKTFTYSNGTYTLSDTKSFAGTDWASNYTGLNNNHYTCFTTGTTCSSIYYIFYTTNSTAYYITLTGGKSVEDAISEMLTNSSNATSSTIKTAIDNWYSSNMTSYTDKLEDTPWCNDRSIYQLNGWNPNGGDTTKYLYFGGYGRAYSTYSPSLSCNKNDAFTKDNVAIGNGKLTYPVGLITVDELMLAGGKSSSNSTYYLNTGSGYWSGAPYRYSSSLANEFRVGSTGNLNSVNVYLTRGVRPAVSLKPGIRFASGDGTSDTPYVVE